MSTRSVPESTRNMLALRTEALRQFRIAFKANAPESVLAPIRQEIDRLQTALDYPTAR